MKSTYSTAEVDLCIFDYLLASERMKRVHFPLSAFGRSAVADLAASVPSLGS